MVASAGARQDGRCSPGCSSLTFELILVSVRNDRHSKGERTENQPGRTVPPRSIRAERRGEGTALVARLVVERHALPEDSEEEVGTVEDAGVGQEELLDLGRKSQGVGGDGGQH